MFFMSITLEKATSEDAKGFTLKSEALNFIGGGEKHSVLLTPTNCCFSSHIKI